MQRNKKFDRQKPDVVVPDPAEAAADLLQTIEREVIPRLVLAYRDEEAEQACADARPPPTASEIRAFSKVVLAQDLPGALQQIEVMASNGLSTESVLLDFIAPTARLLGENWDNDLNTFTEVTIALGVLQRVVQVLGPTITPADGNHRGLVVLTAPPGEHHTLGLFLLGELIRREGWGVDVVPGLTGEELINIVSGNHVEMLGFSISHEKFLPPLEPMLSPIRQRSRNPDLKIAVGGSMNLKKFARQHRLTALSDPRSVVQWLDENVSGSRKDTTYKS